MALDSTQTIGTLASTHPSSVRVFQRHGIDFCCGGKKTLADACHGAVTSDQILEEIRAEEAARTPSDIDWTTQPLPALIDHLLKRFHDPLRPELDRLTAMAEKVLRVHGSKDPERLSALARLVAAVRDDMEIHMRKEERILFPAIIAGVGRGVAAPIHVMESDHVATGAQLEELRVLTDNFRVPAAACATWTALWQGLEDLDRDLRLHMHLENNILFPRTLLE